MADIAADLIDSMGNDLTVVNSARVSFEASSEYDYDPINETWGLSERDRKLISYLAKHGHWTPFSHPQITLREDVPIFVARQRFKHMVGFTYNEVSRRYVDDEPTFFTPDAFRKRAENAKQGSSDEIVTRVEWWDPVVGPTGNVWDEPLEWLDCYHQRALDAYNSLLKAGVAPEQARMVLPQSMMTSYYVTGSLAAFARAYKQRIDGHAQKEIRDLAVIWDRLIRPLYPVSWAALTASA